ncbi:hypothetical protein SANT12839_079820 [Streptomyces antimycoticus]|uniref:Uncharacterized protein n=1 Tax=Streptomyces antimycoticus TaxID=68175 RepID=A0A4D4KK09_9ACTN|nr:hypothetical protein [Streptomyces antimycoticus]GDY47100.1 hypothetical protein SANT12839_079820 [Streptomyces antimycoticus]
MDDTGPLGEGEVEQPDADPGVGDLDADDVPVLGDQPQPGAGPAARRDEGRSRLADDAFGGDAPGDGTLGGGVFDDGAVDDGAVGDGVRADGVRADGVRGDGVRGDEAVGDGPFGDDAFGDQFADDRAHGGGAEPRTADELLPGERGVEVQRPQQ